MDTEDIYYDKYQKYKSKYLELKKQIEQSGGHLSQNPGSNPVVPPGLNLMVGPHSMINGASWPYYTCMTDNKKSQCDDWTAQFFAKGLIYPSPNLNSNEVYRALNVDFQKEENRKQHGYYGDLENYIKYCLNHNNKCQKTI